MKVGYIGLGKLGLSCAEVLAEAHEVIGYDIVDRKSDKIKITTNIEDCFKDTKIIFIAVQTPHAQDYDGSVPVTHLPPMNFDYSHVIEVLKLCQKFCSSDQIVSLISTVLPGTIRREFKNYITNYKFVYNPYLIAMGTEAYDMVNPEMLIIGTEDGDNTPEARFLADFYTNIIQNDAGRLVGSWEEAESYKIFYNTMLSARLSLVNMIQDVAVKLGHMDVDKVTNAIVDSKYKIKDGYYKSGMGDGGGCHPRDNIAMSWLAKDLDLGYDIFHTIAFSREIQSKNMAKVIAKICKEQDLPCVINGKAYKPLVPYTIGSPSVLLGHYLKEEGIQVYYADTFTGDNPNLELGENCRAVCVMAHDPRSVYLNQANAPKSSLYFTLAKGSTIIDPWRSYRNKDYTIVTYGKSHK